MTDRQPEALRLADELEAPIDGFPEATELESKAAAELRRLHAELETLRAKLKTYEDLGDAAARLEIESLKSERDRFRAAYHEWSDKTEWVRKSASANEMGKHIADVLRERIEGLQAALKAAQPVAAPQPGAAYAALPEPQASHLKSCPCGAAPDALDISGEVKAKWACVSGSCCGEWSIEYRNNYAELSSPEAMELATTAWNEAPRASHGQAPAQAAPAYKDSTPELHIGDSAFESWYSTYSPAHKSDKQRARDAYAAGMGDPLVTAAPAAVAGPSLYQVMAVAKAIHATTPDADDWDSLRQCEVDALRGRAEKVLAALAAAPTTQPAPQQVLTLHDLKAALDVFNTARAGSDKPSGYLRGIGAVLIHWEGRSSATSVQEDAARWHWIAEYLVGPRTDLDDEIVASETVNDLRKLVDAARAAQEGKNHDN